MPDHQSIAATGRIIDVFAHRFTLRDGDGIVHLADLGPKGADLFALEAGLDVTIEGERKPSEIKVTRIARANAVPIDIDHKKKPHDHAPAEPKAALTAVKSAGFEPVGRPRRKPKHFEVLGRRGDRFVECHVELDGHIRKEKPVAADDRKWSDEIAAAA